MADLAPPSNPYDSLPVTPRTRSAAEEAFLNNTLTQTASAGAAPVGQGAEASTAAPSRAENERPITGRPPFPTRSSTNYVEAAASSSPPTQSNSTASGALPAATLAPRPRAIKMPISPSDDDLAAQNAAAEQAWLSEQAAAKRTSVDMRSEAMAGLSPVSSRGGGDVAPVTARPGELARQQSWSAQDARRQMQEPLMKGGGGADHGYSASGGRSAKE